MNKLTNALTNEQIKMSSSSKFVTMATQKWPKDPIFNLLRLITSELVGERFEFYIFVLTNIMMLVCQTLHSNCT